MPTPGVKVHGLQQVYRGLKLADEEIARDLKDEMAVAGELVRKDARRRFTPYDKFSAQGFKTVVRPTSRQSLVSVEQNLRKTNAQHPEWGAKQMVHALIPAREAMMPEIVRHLDHVVDRVLGMHGF